MGDCRRVQRKNCSARDEYRISIASTYESMMKYSVQNNNIGNINHNERRRESILLNQLGKVNKR